jgi:hypothetical protein
MALAQTGGTLYSNTALAATKQVVIAAPCLVFNIFVFNPDTTATSYIQFFDALTADVTVGSTAPTFVIPMGLRTGSTIALNCPRAFRTGVVIACTATATGSGAPSTSAVVSLDYVYG